MTGDELERAGRKLFGKRWKAPMARALGRDASMVWRYATDKIAIPPVVQLAVRGLLAIKQIRRR